MAKPPELLPPQAYARVFEGIPEGAQILDELTRVFCRPPVRKGGIDAVLETFHRGGSRSVIEYIVARINQAHGVYDQGESNDD